jgi:hypothetical protein
MKGRDFPRLAALLAQTAEVYGKDRPTAGALKVFAAALSDYDVDDVQHALSVHVRTNKFWPRPADLIEILEGTAEDRARMAWQKVKSAQRRYGAHYSVAFEDPLIHYAVERLGGWTALSQIESKDEPFREKDFIGWYIKGERTGIGWGQVSAKLPGLHELNNRQCGTDPASLGLKSTYTGSTIHIGGTETHSTIEGRSEEGKVRELISGVTETVRRNDS